VASFEYFGSLITNNEDTIMEINRRTSIALQKLKQPKKLWGGTNGTTKIRFLRACICPIGTYACETCIFNKAAEKYINAFEHKCYRQFLRYHGLRKEPKNPFDRNYIFLKVGH
jgi:hypothetical protein